MPCSTIVPLHTASSGVPPGAAMSTPSSSDHVAGGETSPLGIGKVKPPLEGALGGGPELELELPDPVEAPDEEPALVARWAAARRAACRRLSCVVSEATCALALLSLPAVASRARAAPSRCERRLIRREATLLRSVR